MKKIIKIAEKFSNINLVEWLRNNKIVLEKQKYFQMKQKLMIID